MLALHGVLHLVNSCHINIAHTKGECSTQTYNAGAEPATVHIGTPWRLPPPRAWLCAFTVKNARNSVSWSAGDLLQL